MPPARNVTMGGGPGGGPAGTPHPAGCRRRGPIRPRHFPASTPGSPCSTVHRGRGMVRCFPRGRSCGIIQSGSREAICGKGRGVGAVSEPFTETGTGRSATRLTRAVRCSGCGAGPRDPAEAADLATVWLIRGTDRTVVAVRYCRGCAPTGPVGEIECVLCGDGPLLGGDLADGDLLTSAAVDEWLATSGWRPAGPWCPVCDPRRPSGRHLPRPA